LSAPRAENWQEVEALVMDALDEWRTGALALFGAEDFRPVPR
jgi:hypothetical protein